MLFSCNSAFDVVFVRKEEAQDSSRANNDKQDPLGQIETQTPD